MTRDRQYEQRESNGVTYRYYMTRATNLIEGFVLGLGFEQDLEEAVKCAKMAREHRLEYEKLGGFQLKKPLKE